MSGNEPSPPRSDDPRGVAVVGHAGRDLVLQVGRLPEKGSSTSVRARIERLGGKGANIAVGVRQLNPDCRVALVAAVGVDEAGDRVLQEAANGGLEVRQVARRGTTALLIDVVDQDAGRMLLEDLVPESFLDARDVEDAAHEIAGASVVVLQLQQAPAALLAAARIARSAGAAVVLDGAVEGGARDELLAAAAVVRADAPEAESLTGARIRDRADAEAAARTLLSHGPSLVVLAIPGEGDLAVWAEGARLFPHAESRIVDATGAGDAFVAGIVTGLRAGEGPEQTARRGADAAAAVVQVLGGHPRLGSARAGSGERT